MKVPGFLWRHRRSVAVLVLVAPLLVTGSLAVFAANGLAIGLVGYLAFRAFEGK